MRSRNCYFSLYLRAVDLNTGRRYPEVAYNGWTKREAVRNYKANHGLKYKRNIIIFEC